MRYIARMCCLIDFIFDSTRRRIWVRARAKIRSTIKPFIVLLRRCGSTAEFETNGTNLQGQKSRTTGLPSDFSHCLQHLALVIADRNYQQPAFRKLLPQRGRNAIGRRSYDDAVDGALCWTAQRAVALDHANILVGQRLERVGGVRASAGCRSIVSTD